MLPGLPLLLSYARRLAANGTQRHSAPGRPLAGALAGGGLGASPAVPVGHRAGGAPALLTLRALQQRLLFGVVRRARVPSWWGVGACRKAEEEEAAWELMTLPSRLPELK